MDRHTWIDERLAAIPLFAGLSKKLLREVSSLATRLDFPAGKELTHQGEIGHEFLILLDGEVDVQIDGKSVATRGPGDYFGEIALLADRPRTATVIAKTPVSAEVIGRREFATLIHDVPEISQQLLATMADRLAENEEPAH
jgi:CRP/FNR family cyclic AMP-dependent transcriptional regulator